VRGNVVKRARKIELDMRASDCRNSTAYSLFQFTEFKLKLFTLFSVAVLNRSFAVCLCSRQFGAVSRVKCQWLRGFSFREVTDIEGM